MTKKRVLIVLLILLSLSVVSIVGYKTSQYITEKRVAYEEKKRIVNNSIFELAYTIQNKVLFGIGFSEYTPYTKKYEYELQISILFYYNNTTNTIELSEVEGFLESPTNPDGTPKIWEDDKTGIVKDFVDWSSSNMDERFYYRENLFGLLVDYCVQNPDCPYKVLSDLTPEQIIELDKKYLDPDYDLVLK